MEMRHCSEAARRSVAARPQRANTRSPASAHLIALSPRAPNTSSDWLAHDWSILSRSLMFVFNHYVGVSDAKAAGFLAAALTVGAAAIALRPASVAATLFYWLSLTLLALVHRFVHDGHFGRGHQLSDHSQCLVGRAPTKGSCGRSFVS
jgi:hypothetical protein